MKKCLGVLAILLYAGTAWAVGAKLYPGARQDAAEGAHFQSEKAKASPALRAKMGQQTFYTTPDSFAKVYAFYKKLYPETDKNIKKMDVPLSGGGTLSEAYFCLDGAVAINRSKNWLKIQRPFFPAAASRGAQRQAKIEDVTVITVIQK
jgi:hypothetical protein